MTENVGAVQELLRVFGGEEFCWADFDAAVAVGFRRDAAEVFAGALFCLACGLELALGFSGFFTLLDSALLSGAEGVPSKLCVGLGGIEGERRLG